MSVNMIDMHYKIKALEGVVSVLIAGLSVNNPGLVNEIKRILDENINHPGQPDGFIHALQELRSGMENIQVKYE
ncbi:hypothetical protein ACK35S_13975 [Aeromonas veronii]|uniref:hypothetical protein n=2 Tax=Aeromonas veronii TaxID=654 RepID=UPI001F2AF598|nr:hypothetical protein [Aeromonas veronii]MCF5868198.1 hypothetical protein [Aeromonas veronii]